MNCPNCNCASSDVTETISQEVINYRRRKCHECGTIFFTTEEMSRTEDIRPIFNQRSSERTKKFRAKAKGVEYVPDFEQARTEGPKRPTQSLFEMRPKA